MGLKGEPEERKDVWETKGGCGGGGLDELTPSLWVSQRANMQEMLPDSPWYWLALRPGIHLAHAHFSAICGAGRRGWVRAWLACVCV